AAGLGDDRARQAHRRHLHSAALSQTHEQPRRGPAGSRRDHGRGGSAVCEAGARRRALPAGRRRSRQRDRQVRAADPLPAPQGRRQPVYSAGRGVAPVRVRRARAREGGPAERVRRARSRRLQGLGDHRARSGLRPHAEGGGGHQQAVRRENPEAEGVGPMRKVVLLSLLTVFASFASFASFAFFESGVEVKVNEAAKRVDVTIDGKPFTSYIWPSTLKKPVLYPLRTAKGTAVTRGFPLDPRPRERVDHPHHVGLWLNHGNVNGLDFWNNSDAIKPEDAPKMGTILHRRIVEAKSGAEQGELVVETAWMAPGNKQLLKETTRFGFSGGPDSRTIDRVTTLT